METVLASIIERGDLGHLALFLWAVSASGLLLIMTREVFKVHARFNAFLRELTRFNERARRLP